MHGTCEEIGMSRWDFGLYMEEHMKYKWKAHLIRNPKGITNLDSEFLGGNYTCFRWATRQNFLTES